MDQPSILAESKLVSNSHPVANYSYPRSDNNYAGSSSSSRYSPSRYSPSRYSPTGRYSPSRYSPSPSSARYDRSDRPRGSGGSALSDSTEPQASSRSGTPVLSERSARSSLGSESSAPGLVDDFTDSEVSLDDDYQWHSHMTQLWDSFWTKDALEKSMSELLLHPNMHYPALIPSPHSRRVHGAPPDGPYSAWPLPNGSPQEGQRNRKPAGSYSPSGRRPSITYSPFPQRTSPPPPTAPLLPGRARRPQLKVLPSLRPPRPLPLAMDALSRPEKDALPQSPTMVNTGASCSSHPDDPASPSQPEQLIAAALQLRSCSNASVVLTPPRLHRKPVCRGQGEQATRVPHFNAPLAARGRQPCRAPQSPTAVWEPQPSPRAGHDRGPPSLPTAIHLPSAAAETDDTAESPRPPQRPARPPRPGNDLIEACLPRPPMAPGAADQRIRHHVLLHRPLSIDSRPSSPAVPRKTASLDDKAKPLPAMPGLEPATASRSTTDLPLRRAEVNAGPRHHRSVAAFLNRPLPPLPALESQSRSLASPTPEPEPTPRSVFEDDSDDDDDADRRRSFFRFHRRTESDSRRATRAAHDSSSSSLARRARALASPSSPPRHEPHRDRPAKHSKLDVFSLVIGRLT